MNSEGAWKSFFVKEFGGKTKTRPKLSLKTFAQKNLGPEPYTIWAQNFRSKLSLKNFRSKPAQNVLGPEP